MSEQTKQQVYVSLASRGFVGNEMEKKIDDIIAAIPEATKSAYPTDRYECANAFMEKYFADAPSVGASAHVAPASAPSMPQSYTSEQLAQVNQILNANPAVKRERTLKTSISKLLVDKPKPSTYLKAEQTVVPKCDAAKLASYESMLVDTDENKAAFAEIKAAVENGTALKIFINDKSQKTAGYEITTPSAEAGSDKMEQKFLTPKKLLGFVATQLLGYIVAPENGQGMACKLAWQKPTNKTNVAANKTDAGTPRLRVSGGKIAKENPAMNEVISKLVQGKTADGKLRIEKTFQIVSKKKEDGSPIIRTVRLSGDSKVPEFVRINNAYEEAFPMKSTNAQGIPSAVEMAKIQEAQRFTIASVISSGSEVRAAEFGIEGLQKTLAEMTLNAPAPSIG